MVIDLDDIFRYDDPPAVAVAKTSSAAAPEPSPEVITAPMSETITEPAHHGVVEEFQTERSRLLLADPGRFFDGWIYRDGSWLAPWYRRFGN